MQFLNFIGAKNLVEANLVEVAPWDFNIPDADNPLKKIPKDKRRLVLLKPGTAWQVYSSVRGAARNLRISKTNPPAGIRGIVVDYDMVSDLTTVMNYIRQMPEQLQPNFVEVSLGNKIRLIWVFEKEILVPNTEFCIEFLKAFSVKVEAPTLLPGYDEASLKPTEMWTNGGVWYEVNPVPIAFDFCFGVVCSVSKKSTLFDKGEIPLDIIAAEVQKRFPGRWQGDFKVDGLGVRFWDETADNTTGCQIKPDGMLCFTGTEPFMKWEQIFGRPWCEEQRVLNLGRAANSIFFDGKTYWELNAGRWESSARADVILRLKGRGLTDKTPKGATQSDVERVLDHIQVNCRVQGAAPLINYPPGIVEFGPDRILNTARLNVTQPIAGTSDPEKDFPWIWNFLKGLFPRLELLPLDHFLCWLRRSYRVVLQHQRFMGQAVFICGPKNNGKTLLCLRIVAPLLGGRHANPIEYMTGEASFNAELFEAALLAINDEDSPGTEAARKRMLAKLKGLVVNPVHKYHAKFEKAVTIDWVGRIFVTLNDDPGSVGMLMEVENNTKDKQMFFASQPYKGVFPPQDELEPRIANELPLFAHWLLNVYQPPKEVLSDDRMGVKSYFDPRILELSHQQTFASNLAELLKVWVRVDAYWGPEDKPVAEWVGTPTDLLTCLQTCDATAGVAREWKQHSVAKSLTALAKHDGSGVKFNGENGREFKILRA
jgi:hypothetical protein